MTAPAYGPAPFQHDGLFLRAYLGIGYGRFGSEVPGTGQVIIDGGGAGLALAAGWTIRPNLILYLELFGNGMGQPDVTVDGTTFETSEDASASVAGLGPGLAFYTRTNVFVSGTLGISRIVVTDNDETIGESQAGLGFNGMVGKEFWLSPTFALGVVGQLFLGSMKDEQDSDITWGAFGLTLGVSATYN
jgi:hypothetical protein